MKMWKAAALTTALLVAVALGAAFAPAATGQTITTWRPDQGVGLLFLGAGQIGVEIRDLDDEDAKAGKAAGVLIEDVTEGGPAEKAGLKKGDIVAEYDGEKVRSVRQFTRLAAETAAGSKVQVTVRRNGQRTSLTVEPRSGGRVRALGNLDRLGDLENLGRHFDFDYRVPARPTPPNPPSPPRVPCSRPGGLHGAPAPRRSDHGERSVVAARGLLRDRMACS